MKHTVSYSTFWLQFLQAHTPHRPTFSIERPRAILFLSQIKPFPIKKKSTVANGIARPSDRTSQPTFHQSGITRLKRTEEPTLEEYIAGKSERRGWIWKDNNKQVNVGKRDVDNCVVSIRQGRWVNEPLTSSVAISSVGWGGEWFVHHPLDWYLVRMLCEGNLQSSNVTLLLPPHTLRGDCVVLYFCPF